MALLIAFSCFSVIGYAEETEGTEHLTEVPEGYVGIYTKDDLDNIKLDMTGKYILMNDIVFEDSDYEKGGSFYNSGKGWEPIGTESSPFAGTFDGNGYSIHNLYINDATKDYVGLFGYVSGALIGSVTLEDVDIIGGDYDGAIAGYAYNTTIKDVTINGKIVGTFDYVGGISGYLSYSMITDCDFSGSINGENYIGGINGYSHGSSTISACNVQGSVNGSKYVGGITGYQNADSSSNTNYNYVLYCNNAAIVSGSNRIGGIVGKSISLVSYSYGNGYYLYGLSYIQYCSNSGSVTASDCYAGGIVGDVTGDTHETTVNIYYAKCKVEFCYNVADVEAINYAAGGIMGSGTNTESGYCYSVGKIKASTNFGGCYGSLPTSSTSCYYLDESVVNPTCTAGVAKSKDQLLKQTTYENWDFDTVWTMGGREDYPYPELQEVPLILPEDSAHKHEYTSEITIPATHTATGVMTYTCECGDSYTETIDKIATHNYVAVVTAPTCTEKGYTTYICECNDSYIDDYVEAKGHDFKSVVCDATCTEHGYTTFVCECGETYTRDYVNAKGHNYTSEITTPATHTATGVMTFTCECGDSYTKEIDKTATHDFKATVTAPTCTEQGYTTYTCKCGETYTRDYTDVKGHNHVAVITAPTCTEQGYTTHTCECGDSYVDNYVDETGHNANGDDVCDNCGETVEVENPSENCSCDCHKTGISKFFFNLIIFFSKIFGANKVCACGAVHY